MENKEKKTFKEKISSVWGQVKMFFMGLFKVKASNGQRRLVKNPISGKWEWTEGEEIKDKYVSSSFEEVATSSNYENEVEEIGSADEVESLYMTPPSIECKIKGRYIVEFPGVEPYFIKSYHYAGNFSKRKVGNKTKIRQYSYIEFYLPIGVDVELDMIKKSKLKNIGNAKIKIVDATGIPVREIELKNIKIENIHMYNHLVYSDKDGANDVLTCTLEFSHDERVFK